MISKISFSIKKTSQQFVKKVQNRTFSQDKEFITKVVGRDVTKSDFLETQIAGYILPAFACLGIGTSFFIFSNIAESIFIVARDSFPIVAK